MVRARQHCIQWRRGTHVFFLGGGGARAVLFRQTKKFSGRQHFKSSPPPPPSTTLTISDNLDNFPTTLAIFRRVSTIGGACPPAPPAPPPPPDHGATDCIAQLVRALQRQSQGRREPIVAFFATALLVRSDKCI